MANAKADLPHRPVLELPALEPMKMPFVKAKTAAVLQSKLDAARENLQKKNRQLEKAEAKFKAVLDDLKREADAPPDTGSSLANLLRVMDTRKLLSFRYLRGEGIEVGALHRPTPTAPGARTRYYDYMSAEDSRKRLPELADEVFVEVDFIGDGETLALIPDASQDYVIANHMLEHCQNAIGTLRVFWAKLRPGGALYITLPDKRYTFDFRRPSTPFEHLVEDERKGPSASLYRHYLEYQKLVQLKADHELESEEAVLKMPHVDIHFHAWTQFDIMEMFILLHREYGFAWEIDAIMRKPGEVVTVLRKEEVVSWDRANPGTQPC